MGTPALSTILENLFRTIPELRNRYRTELAWWGEDDAPGAYIVFGFVVEPYVQECLDADRRGDLSQVFDSFEQMAKSSNAEVVNLLQVGILERLVAEPNRLATAWIHMGPVTKAIARETADTLRLRRNLPAGN
jgi:hypothetical protein